MDPHFFLPCFHGPRASRLGHKRKKKLGPNLPYGPRIQLTRGIYINYLYYIKKVCILSDPSVLVILKLVYPVNH